MRLGGRALANSPGGTKQRVLGFGGRAGLVAHFTYVKAAVANGFGVLRTFPAHWKALDSAEKALYQPPYIVIFTIGSHNI